MSLNSSITTNWEEIPEVSGRFCVIAHTSEGEFVYSRYATAAHRDTAYSIARGELDLDNEMLRDGAKYTIGFSDDVIRFSKRDDPVAENIND